MSERVEGQLALSMVGTPFALFRQTEMHEAEAAAASGDVQQHIYTICRRPRISIDPKSMKVTPATISGDFVARVGGLETRVPFQRRNDFGPSVVVDLKYPFTEIGLVVDGVEKSRSSAAILMTLFTAKPPPDLHVHPLTDLEILYIGQSFGEAGEKSVFGRLRAHGTLQEIYADSARQDPDSEIWLIAWNFDETKIAVLASGDVSSDSLEVERVHDFMTKSEMSLQHKINYTEAALIRYFQPAYNITFKDKFPSETHSSYSECYALNLNSVIVEIQTEYLATRVRTATRAPAFAHLAHFPLKTAEERRRIFDFVAATPSGPVY